LSKTVVGLFDDFTQAQNAVQDLENLGIARNDISLVANNADGQYDQYKNNAAVYDAPDHSIHGVGAGAITGTFVGGGLGLLAGLGMLAIPGFGPVVAAGWIVSTIAGAGIGAAAGGLLGALVDAGVPHEEAQLYNEGVRRGGTLIAVKSPDDMANRVAEVLNRFGAVNIDERADSYRQPYDISAPEATASTTTATTTDWTPPANPAAPTMPPGFVPFEPVDMQHTSRDAYSGDYEREINKN